MKASQRLLIWILSLFLISCNIGDKDFSKYSDDKNDIKAYNLISALEAHQLLAKDDHVYIPIQVSKAEAFEKGHIPNALNIWRPDYGSDIKDPYGGLIPEREKLQDLLRKFGYENGNELLLYDPKGNVDALRFAWVLNLYGFDNFKIINGGLNSWRKNDLPISTEKPAWPETSSYVLSDTFNEDMIARAEDILASIIDPNILLIDTREDYEYLGLPFIKSGKVNAYKSGAFDRGSIPGAIHLNWSDLADLNNDHRIKSEKNLRFNLAQKGVSGDKEIILYCHSGSRTSHTYYVLKNVLGYKNVKNYDGSWIEWSYLNTTDPKYVINQLSSDIEFQAAQDSLSKELKSK